jgi:hypothetical protein
MFRSTIKWAPTLLEGSSHEANDFCVLLPCSAYSLLDEPTLEDILL